MQPDKIEKFDKEISYNPLAFIGFPGCIIIGEQLSVKSAEKDRKRVRERVRERERVLEVEAVIIFCYNGDTRRIYISGWFSTPTSCRVAVQKKDRIASGWYSYTLQSYRGLEMPKEHAWINIKRPFREKTSVTINAESTLICVMSEGILASVFSW